MITVFSQSFNIFIFIILNVILSILTTILHKFIPNYPINTKPAGDKSLSESMHTVSFRFVGFWGLFTGTGIISVKWQWNM